MALVFKVIIVLFFISILFCLGTALYYLVTEKGDSTRIVKALSWRIGLSILLFILLFVGFAFRWITPHGVGG
ncbi:MAG: twin transmembrane helix small protein [Gammaproteobacteria bacterium]